MGNCEEPDCREEAAVGWGNPPKMVCMKHFDQRLIEVRQTVDRARQLCDERIERRAGGRSVEVDVTVQRRKNSS